MSVLILSLALAPFALVAKSTVLLPDEIDYGRTYSLVDYDTIEVIK